MTWKEFKEKVESLGVRDTDCIEYIDVAGRCAIGVDKEDGVVTIDG